MVIVLCSIGRCVIFGATRMPVRPCDERPPAMYGHFCLVPRVSVHDRYYCTLNVLGFEGTHLAVFDSDMPHARVTPSIVFEKSYKPSMSVHICYPNTDRRTEVLTPREPVVFTWCHDVCQVERLLQVLLS